MIYAFWVSTSKLAACYEVKKQIAIFPAINRTITQHC